jgi:hypothetical protein
MRTLGSHIDDVAARELELFRLATRELGPGAIPSR